MIKLNIGDLVEVKPPAPGEERGYVKGIGYVKNKTSTRGRYSTWITIQWIDEPQEVLEYTRGEIAILIDSWNVYPVINNKIK